MSFAMPSNLLIHSMAEFAGITLPALEAAGAQHVAEVGAEHGGNTRLLADWLEPRGGQLYSIDPSPSSEFLDWLPGQTHVTHIAQPSLDAIGETPPVDAWFIDGDHNWYTVHHELVAVRAHARRHDKPFLVFLHDISWPCARRDMYYAPQRIPAQYRHRHSYDCGVTLGNPGTIDGGFRGMGQFACALHEGGPRNGVLTAIEDFVALEPEAYWFANIPAVFGLGVLFERTHCAVGALTNLLAPSHDNPLLARLEQNRLANYLTVIEWQDRDAARMRDKAA
jgi:Methyltransferase domain